MTDHIKAARLIWGESAILPFADLERFWAIAFAAGMERAAEIAEGRLKEGLNFEGCAAAIRAHAQNRPKPLHDGSVS